MVVPKFSVCLVLCLGLVSLVFSSESSLVEKLIKEIEELKKTTAEEIEELKKTTAEEIEELKTHLHDADNKIESLQADNQKLKELHHNKRFVLSDNPFAEKPAFTAGLTHHATNLGASQSIIFDHVFTNDLGGYSPISGIFTAPKNGTYFFTAVTMSFPGQYVETELCLNGNALVYMYSFDTHFEQGTNSVVLVLKAGDMVWVRHHNTEGSIVHGDNWSTFSGFMI